MPVRAYYDTCISTTSDYATRSLLCRRYASTMATVPVLFLFSVKYACNMFHMFVLFLCYT